MKYSTLLLVMLLILPVLSVEARGGRGRGGFGGLFGTWRKTKSKQTNSRNSGRSVINGMPMHTTITKNRPSKTNFNTRPQTGNRAHHSGGYAHYPYAQYVPPGATHYASHAAIPSGAVYVPHTPPYSSSSDLSDFLMGYMTGRLLTISTYPHQHVHHIHYQQISQDSGKKVIIIENGTTSNDNHWPMDSDVPLSPFNTSLNTTENGMATTYPLFRRVSEHGSALLSTTTPSTSSSTNSTPETPPGGIICMPMIFNETDSTDISKTIQVEKLVCFPAPPPPPATASQEHDGWNCVIRYFIETNPNNPSETIEVPRKHCSPSTTERSEPVVGDINTEST